MPWKVYLLCCPACYILSQLGNLLKFIANNSFLSYKKFHSLHSFSLVLMKLLTLNTSHHFMTNKSKLKCNPTEQRYILTWARFKDSARFKKCIGINVIFPKMNSANNHADFFLLRTQSSRISNMKYHHVSFVIFLFIFTLSQTTHWWWPKPCCLHLV